MPRLLILVLLVLLGAVVVAAFPSRAIAAAACDVAVASPLDFGSVDTLSAIGASTSTGIHIACSDVTEGVDTVTVCAALGAGNGGSSGSLRLMKDASDNALAYGLYADGSGSTPWGDSSGSLGQARQISVPVTSGTGEIDVTLFGKVAGPQTTVPVGTYGSTIGAAADAVFYYDEGTSLNCAAPSGQNTTTTIAVAAQVQAACLVATADLAFGSTGVITHNIDAEADIGVTCTPGIVYDVSIDDGQHASSGTRRMQASGGLTITYGLYKDANRTQPWGSGGAAKPDDRSCATETVYGRVPPQSASVGSYSDTVVVTIVYDDGS